MNPKRILVADDEPHLTRVIEILLRRESYVVDVVRDGREAMDYILRCPTGRTSDRHSICRG